MSHVTFGTKAETLERLAPHLATARILPLVHFSVDDWVRDAPSILSAIAGEAWGSSSLIVRSSAHAEDSAAGSMAGRFRSVLNVAGSAKLRQAIDDVVESYGAAGGRTDLVLVQPMLQDVALSGVAFSQDPNTGSPYIVINCACDPDTTAVTGGSAAPVRTAFVWRDAPVRPAAPFGAVVDLVKELERLFDGVPLDIEFAQDHHGALWLFQVRPLLMRTPAAIGPAAHTEALAAIAAKVDAASRPHPYLHGRRTVYGVMPDWNPAEIVGVRPRPLALSLYREMITDAIWAYQRHNYGYKNLRSFPLLLDFQGLPYVDVRVSFNSFVPDDVPAELADRLVDYYIQRLLDAPALHDKVEFEIVLSCYSFDLDARLAELRRHGFSAADAAFMRDSLNRLTNRIINRDTGLWRGDLERIEKLVGRHLVVSRSNLDLVSRIYWLLEDCKRYGTLPFAGLARAGFIGVQILRSLVGVGVLSELDRAAFMAGLDTISAKMGRELSQLDRDAFLREYGHLRPGTYDILAPRYDEAPERYFTWSRPDAKASHDDRRPFALSLAQMRDIEALLADHRIDHDVVGLFGFLEAGIRGREYSKFVFSRSLSDALVLIGQLGEEHGFSRDDMSYADIGSIYRLYASAANPGQALAESIERGRRAYDRTRAIAMPPLLSRGDDVWWFEMPASEPNFLTQRRVSGPVGHLDVDADLSGTIALVANADPGYDWILSRGIAGFITAYGGANSHMAIRASELDLPAVIGAGEVLFARWSAAQQLEIDAANRQVWVIR